AAQGCTNGRALRPAPGAPGNRGASAWPPSQSMHPLVVVPRRALDAGVAAGDVLLLQLLEVAHAGHHVVALGRMAVLGLLQAPLGLLLVAHELLHRVPHGV